MRVRQAPLSESRTGIRSALGGLGHELTGPRLLCAFVNLMPDSAFIRTEAQFAALIRSRPGIRVEVQRFALVDTPHDDQVTAWIADRYLPFDHLWRTEPALVIVTGAQPRATRLDDEPCWRPIVELLDWSRARRTSVMLSCLSAHVALRHLDGIERSAVPAKQTGVFWHDVDGTHALSRGLVDPLPLPHSRYNAVPTDALGGAGYSVAVSSAVAGWAVASKLDGPCEIVLVQGHPEYEAGSLLAEYRRDAMRFADGTSKQPPPLPVACVAASDWPVLIEAHEALLRGGGIGTMLSRDVYRGLAERAPWPWRRDALRFGRNVVSAALARA